jgi:hypothetical protein
MHSREFDLHDYHKAIFGVVNQFMQTQQKPHLDVVRHILGYIKHTLQCGIFYEGKNHLEVNGYNDVNWVGNISNKRSTNAFMFFFGMVLLVKIRKSDQQWYCQEQRLNKKVQ